MSKINETNTKTKINIGPKASIQVHSGAKKTPAICASFQTGKYLGAEYIHLNISEKEKGNVSITEKIDPIEFMKTDAEAMKLGHNRPKSPANKL